CAMFMLIPPAPTTSAIGRSGLLSNVGRGRISFVPSGIFIPLCFLYAWKAADYRTCYSYASTSAFPSRMIVMPNASVPEIAHMAGRHHAELRIAIRDGLKLHELGAAPGLHEFTVPAFGQTRRKSPLRESRIDLEDQLNIAAFDEIEDRRPA